MCLKILADARLWGFLLEVDRELAQAVHDGGCPSCGGALHRADYPRKPRSGKPWDLPPGHTLRMSYCCSEDGCRCRATPPSVRFLGRRVYLHVFVLLITAMRQGPTPHGLRALERLFGVTRRTIARWQKWWQEFFPRTVFWRDARARFLPPLREAALPWEFQRVFDFGLGTQRLLECLRFLAPITCRRGLVVHPG